MTVKFPKYSAPGYCENVLRLSAPLPLPPPAQPGLSRERRGWELGIVQQITASNICPSAARHTGQGNDEWERRPAPCGAFHTCTMIQAEDALQGLAGCKEQYNVAQAPKYSEKQEELGIWVLGSSNGCSLSLLPCSRAASGTAVVLAFLPGTRTVPDLCTEISSIQRNTEEIFAERIVSRFSTVWKSGIPLPSENGSSAPESHPKTYFNSPFCSGGASPCSGCCQG